MNGATNSNNVNPRGNIIPCALALLVALWAVGVPAAQAQTGPGGVGNSSNNILWLEGNSGTVQNTSSPYDTPSINGGEVTTWLDQSGNDNHFTQSSSGQRPTLTNSGINGLPAVVFDGSNDRLINSTWGSYLNGKSGITAFFVVKSDETGNDRGFFRSADPLNGNTTEGGLTFRYDDAGSGGDEDNIVKFGIRTTGTLNGGEYQGVTGTIVGGAATQSTKPTMYMVRWGSGEYLEFFMNAVRDGDLRYDPDGASGGTLTNASTGYLGQARATSDSDDFWDGQIAEVIIFDEAINNTQRRLIENYLGQKYDISISEEFYAFNAPESDLAGIGRKSATDFHLEASSSILTIRKNSASDLADDDFVMFAHNDRDISFSALEAPSAEARKILREWRVDVSGTQPQTVDIVADLSSLSLPSGYNDFAIFTNSGGGNFATNATHYDLEYDSATGTWIATDVVVNRSTVITVGAVDRQISFSLEEDSAFENLGGNGNNKPYDPEISVELNYASSEALTIPIEITSGLFSPVLGEDEDFDTFESDGATTTGTFTLPANTLTYEFNTTASTTPLTLFNDNEEEDDTEYVNLTFVEGSFPAVLSVGDVDAMRFGIIDDEAAKRIAFSNSPFHTETVATYNPAQSTEGGTGDVSVQTFELAIQSNVAAATVVFFEIAGTATPGVDYVIPSAYRRSGGAPSSTNLGAVPFTDGESKATFTINILGDELYENPEEALIINLTSAEGGTIDERDNAITEITHTIFEAVPDPAPTLSFTATGGSRSEGGESYLEIAVELSEVSGTDASFEFEIDGASTASGGGVDYTLLSSSPLTIPAGDIQTTIEVVINDDIIEEASEDIIFNLTSATDATLGTPSTYTHGIIDDDGIGPNGPGGVGDPDALTLWLRSDSTTADPDQPVSLWLDRSGNNNDFAQSSSGNQPVLRTSGARLMNGRPVLDFDGSDDYLEDEDGESYINGMQGFSLFAAARVDATGVNDGFFASNTPGSPNDDTILLRYDASDSGRSNVIRANINTTGSGEIDDSQKLISSAGQQSTSSQFIGFTWGTEENSNLYVNGAEDTNLNLDPSTGRNGVLKSATTALVGRGGANDGDLDGVLGEVFLYTQKLNQAQRTIIHNYLSAQYDVAIPSSIDFYAGDEAANGDYDFDVLGIGQDGTTDFHGAADLGGLAISSRSGVEDGDYLFAGHNSVENYITNSDITGVSGLEARVQRVWYVDKTDANNTLLTDVTLDLSDAGLGADAITDIGAASNYVLLERSSATGSWSVLATASEVDGDEIAFVNINLKDGNYYTLGTTDQAASPLNTTALVITGLFGTGDAVEGTYGNDAGYRMLSAPLAGLTAADLRSTTDPMFVEFDLPQFHMLYTWDSDPAGSNPDGNYVAATQTTPLINGRGFLLYIFDDEGTPDADPVNPNLTIEPIGGTVVGGKEVVVGDNAPTGDAPLSTAADYHLLGNPYPQPYDLSGLNLTEQGFQATVQVYNHDTESYVLYTQNADTDDILAPWQGFFVQRDASAGFDGTTLTFDPNGRTLTGNRVVLGNKSIRPAARIDFEVVAKNQKGKAVAKDMAASLLLHPEAKEGWDAWDATKLVPYTAERALLSFAGELNGEPTLKAMESLPLDLDGTVEVPVDFSSNISKDGTVTIRAPRWKNVPRGVKLTLVDMVENKSIELTKSASYTFEYAADQSKANRGQVSMRRGRVPAQVPGLTMSADGVSPVEAKASDAPRFILRIEPTEAIPPAKISGINAKQEGTDVVLSWQTTEERDVTYFGIEHRAVDRLMFEEVGQERAASKSGGTQDYQFRIRDLDYGTHTFRLRQKDSSGKSMISEEVTIEVKLAEKYDLSKSYPNPFTNTATFDLAVRESQKVKVTVYDVLGRRVSTLFDGELPANRTERIRFESRGLGSGVYFVRVVGEDFATTRKAVLVK